MKALVKFNDIIKIEDSEQGFVTIHYRTPMAVCDQLYSETADKLDCYVRVRQMTVPKGQLINLYA